MTQGQLSQQAIYVKILGFPYPAPKSYARLPEKSMERKKRWRGRGENVLVYAVFEEIFGAGIGLVAIDARNHAIGKTYSGSNREVPSCDGRTLARRVWHHSHLE